MSEMGVNRREKFVRESRIGRADRQTDRQKKTRLLLTGGQIMCLWHLLPPPPTTQGRRASRLRGWCVSLSALLLFRARASSPLPHDWWSAPVWHASREIGNGPGRQGCASQWMQAPEAPHEEGPQSSNSLSNQSRGKGSIAIKTHPPRVSPSIETRLTPTIPSPRTQTRLDAR